MGAVDDDADRLAAVFGRHELDDGIGVDDPLVRAGRPRAAQQHVDLRQTAPRIPEEPAHRCAVRRLEQTGLGEMRHHDDQDQREAARRTLGLDGGFKIAGAAMQCHVTQGWFEDRSAKEKEAPAAPPPPR